MKIDHQKFNYLRLAMMAGTAFTAIMSTTLPVRAVTNEPQITGLGRVAPDIREGVLLNMSLKSFPGRLIPKGNLNGACTGVLVGTPNKTFDIPVETHAVLTAGHCIYPGPGRGEPFHWDIAAPYAAENHVHPAFGLKAVHYVDRRGDRLDVAETYPDWITYDGIFDLKSANQGLRSNINSLHDLGLICLAEPIKTLLPTLDTKTHVGVPADVIAVGRWNNLINVDRSRYPQGLGKFQELFSTYTLLTAKVDWQSPNEFYVLSPGLGSVVDFGDSGGPAFLAGTHKLVGIITRKYFELEQFGPTLVPVIKGAGFSRLDDPNVASWLQYQIDHCNGTNPPRLAGDGGGH